MATTKRAAACGLAALALIGGTCLPITAWAENPPESSTSKQAPQTASETALESEEGETEPMRSDNSIQGGTQVTILQSNASEAAVMEEEKQPLADTGDEAQANMVAAVLAAAMGSAAIAGAARGKRKGGSLHENAHRS